MDNHLLPIIPFAPVVMARGEGSYVYDQAGRKYLDLTSGQFCAILGHSNAEVQARLAERTARLVHTSTSVVSEEVLTGAAELHRISGDMGASSIILSTGAEVVEFCLRYAKRIQGKPGVLCFTKGYHGLTLGAQSVTFAGRYASPPVPGVYATPIPSNGAGDAEIDASLDDVDRILSHQTDIAAFLVEPIVSVGGMLFPPARWFQGVRTLCDKHRVLLVLDECQTGFGRTGDWFAYQTYGFVPDMVATAKGVGLGYPVAAALFRDTLVEAAGPLMAHYSSHQNDPFGAAVITTGIEYIEAHDVLPGVASRGRAILASLEAVCAANPHLTAPRGLGLMLGADLKYDGVDDYRSLYADLNHAMLDRGVLIQGTDGGRTLRFLPDYLIDVDAVAGAFAVLDEVLQTLT